MESKYNLKIKYILCDNGGENLNLEWEAVKSEVKELTIEYTSPKHPDKMELSNADLYISMHECVKFSMLLDSRLT